MFRFVDVGTDYLFLQSMVQFFVLRVVSELIKNLSFHRCYGTQNEDLWAKQMFLIDSSWSIRIPKIMGPNAEEATARAECILLIAPK